MKHPAIPYTAPFILFLLLLLVASRLPFGRWELLLRVCLLSGALWFFSRRVIDLRAPRWAASSLLGLVVFVVWIGPDLLWPAYRSHLIFQNPIMGRVETSLPPGYNTEPLVIFFRVIRAVILVPIIEELFWRAWLMRWLIDHNFSGVPLGAFQASAFWITAILFASEHGPYWDVGLLAGIAYNWWMVRTKSLGDCILAHAGTNLALSAYVVFAGKWEYWL